MADDRLLCRTCGGPREVATRGNDKYVGGAKIRVGDSVISYEGDSLRCSKCDDPHGSFGELYEHQQWGGKLAAGNAGDESVCELRDWMLEEYGDCGLPALNSLRNRLVRRHDLTREQVYVAKLADIVAMLRGEQEQTKGTRESGYEYYVGFRQMGGIVSASARTVRRRLFDTKKLPAPTDKGGNGNAHRWPWSIAKPILEAEFNRKLPDVFPADTLKNNV